MARVSESGLHELIGAAYEAPFHPDGWEQWLKQACSQFSCHAAAIWFSDTTHQEVGFWLAHNIDDAYTRSFQQHYLHVNPWIPRIPEHPGAVKCSWEFMERREFEGSEFYNDWLAPQDTYFLTSLFVHENARRTAHVDFNRQRKRGTFGGEQLRALRALVPHLRRSLDISALRAAQAAQLDTMLAVFEANSLGVVLLDDRAAVVHVSGRAGEILSGRCGLQCLSRRVTARNPGENAILQRHIAKAMNPGVPGEDGVSDALEIAGGRSRGALRIWVTPFPGGNHRDSGLNRVRVAILISTSARAPSQHQRPPGPGWRLTPAEGRLAAALAEGQTLAEAAERLQITRSTARTVLKRIFGKTGTHRQAALVRLTLGAGTAPMVGRAIEEP